MSGRRKELHDRANQIYAVTVRGWITGINPKQVVPTPQNPRTTYKQPRNRDI